MLPYEGRWARRQPGADDVNTAGSSRFCRQLVAFDTTSRNSNLALIDWVEDYLRPLGFTLRAHPRRDGAKANLWATIGPPDVPGFILSGHTDVVPVDGQAWTSDPFRLRLRTGGASTGAAPAT